MKTASWLMGLWLVIALGLLPEIGNAEPDKVAYELQERCANSAREYFRENYTPQEKLPTGTKRHL
jgi:hypothetical protein